MDFAVGAALAAVLREVGQQFIHRFVFRGINQRPASPAEADQAGVSQLIQMERQCGIRDIQFYGNLAGRHSSGSRTNEQAKYSQAVVMGEGGQGSDGVRRFHISKIIER